MYGAMKQNLPTVQMVSGRLLTAKAWARAQRSTLGICGG